MQIVKMITTGIEIRTGKVGENEELIMNYTIAVQGPVMWAFQLPHCCHSTTRFTLWTSFLRRSRRSTSGYRPFRTSTIEKYLAEKELDLTATLDAEMAYSAADFVVIAVPTNYDSTTQHFDTSAVEAVIKLVIEYNPEASWSLSPQFRLVTQRVLEKNITQKNILFSPEFLRESKALYDNLYPSRIIVGCDKDSRAKADVFAKLLQEGAIKEEIPTLFMDLQKQKQ